MFPLDTSREKQVSFDAHTADEYSNPESNWTRRIVLYRARVGDDCVGDANMNAVTSWRRTVEYPRGLGLECRQIDAPSHIRGLTR